MFDVCSSLLNQAEIRAQIGRIEGLVHHDNGPALTFLAKLGFEIDATHTSNREVRLTLDALRLR